MFERFRAAFPPDGLAGEPLPGLDLPGGGTYGGGLVLVHSAESSARASRLIAGAFPEFPGPWRAFAQDWTGRQYAITGGRIQLFEPASGEAFEVDGGTVDLFDVEFVADPVTYLAADLFAEWIASGGTLGWPDGCVGFKVPLFLGGEGEVSNLEVTDLDVYWSLSGQLRSGIAKNS